MSQVRLKHLRGINSSSGNKPIQVIFTSSQIYKIPSGYKSMDAFLVGGGAGGSGGAYSFNDNTDYATEGYGGGSGYTKTEENIAVNKNTLNISVGSGSAGGEGNYQYMYSRHIDAGGKSIITSNSIDIEVNGGSEYYHYWRGGYNINAQNTSTLKNDGGSGGGYSKSNGGSDGSSAKKNFNGREYGGSGQGTTTRAFKETNGTLYAGGGGGGGTFGDTGNSAYGIGGSGGGGNGGRETVIHGNSGTANTGGGGGGGGIWFHYYNGVHSAPRWDVYSGSSGGSGIVIIRLYKNDKRNSTKYNDAYWANHTINL